jgi:RNase P subunit RPR2
VRLFLKEECKNCKRILFPKDLLKRSIKEEEKENASSPNFIFICSCKNQFFPNLKVRIGDLSIYKTEDTPFINPI